MKKVEKKKASQDLWELFVTLHKWIMHIMIRDAPKLNYLSFLPVAFHPMLINRLVEMYEGDCPSAAYYACVNALIGSFCLNDMFGPK